MTPEEQFDHLADTVSKTHTVVTRIEEWTKAHSREDDSRHTEMSRRLGSLEQQSNAVGKMIGLSTVMGAFFGFLFGTFNK